MITPAKALAGLDEFGLTPEVQAGFPGENAKRVFGIQSGSG